MGLVLVSSNSMAKNRILNQRLIANQNLHILCFGKSLDLGFFLSSEENVVPLDIKLFQATGLGPDRKKYFPGPPKYSKQDLIWFVFPDTGGKSFNYLASSPKISQSLYLAKEQVDKLTDSRLAMKLIIGVALSSNLGEESSNLGHMGGKSSNLGKPFRSLRNHL